MSALPAAIGRYEVQAFIARGGMGTLYLASDPVLQRQVAIKLLREADNDELRARFTREARSAANLRHRNIVTIFDVGDHNGQPFMAMEYVQGQTLTSLIESDPPPSVIRRLQLVEELCDGLAYAHKRGVVHRDVKPANLMVDTEGTLKILDFGIARAAAEAGMTQAGLLIGTLNYMSPEQVAGGELDGRSDMFAVGAVLYELLAKRQAFPGSIDAGVLNRILNGEPEPLETVCPHLDPAIYRIVRRALAKAPADRYPDLQQMRTELALARQTLEASALADLDETFAVPPAAESTAPAARTPRRGTDREELARRRTQQIEEYLAAARQALANGDPDAAIASCEQALVLDPNDGRAFDLAERARSERDHAHAQQLLSRARESLKSGDLTLASSLVREALSVVPDSSDAIELGRLVGEARLAQERERQREAAVQGLLGRARAAMERHDLDEARTATQEALAAAPAHKEALQLDEDVRQALMARERELRDANARQTVSEARELFAAGQHTDALDLLESFLPAHPLVSQTWTELSAEAARQSEEAEAAAAAPPPPSAGEATVFAPRPDSAADATVFAPRPERPGSGPAVAAPPAAAMPPAALRPAAAESVESTRIPDAGAPRSEARPAAVGPPRSGSSAGARKPPNEKVAVPVASRPASRSRGKTYAAAAAVLVLLSVAGYFVTRDKAVTTDTLSELDRSAGRSGTDVSPLPPDAPPSPVEGSGQQNDPPPVDERPVEPPPPPQPETTRAPAQEPARGGQKPRAEPTPARGSNNPTRAAAPEPRPPSPSAGSEPERPAPPVEAPPPVATTTTIPPRPEPVEIRPESEPVRNVPAPPAATTTVPAAPPPPPVVPDRRLIENTLAALARGYSTQDPAAIAAVFPSVDRKALQASFADMRELEMRIDVRDVQVDGNTAVVRSTVHQRFRGRVGGERNTSRETEFRLRRSGSGWIIASRQ